MDRDRTSTGDQSGRADEMCSHRDSQKLAKDSMIRQRVTGGMFLSCLGISGIIGLASCRLPWYLAVLVCVFGGAVGMFFGMAVEWIRDSGQARELKARLIQSEMMSDARCREMVRQAVVDTKKECGGFAVEAAKAVSNRVANRIIAKHAGRLLEVEYREATLEEADQIVSEELGALQEAIQDESGQ